MSIYEAVARRVYAVESYCLINQSVNQSVNFIGPEEHGYNNI